MPTRIPKTIAIIQARMGSSRLPGKVLAPILGRPLLACQVERVRDARLLDGMCIATTHQREDDVLVRECEQLGVAVFRGSENDVLDRYAKASENLGAEVVVRLTADCPLIDPGIIDQVVAAYRQAAPNVDYASNTLMRTYPRGMDTEVFSQYSLQQAAAEAREPFEREHVTPFFYGHPERFRLISVTNSKNESRHRWTVDTAEDLELIRRIFTALYPHNLRFTIEDVLALLTENPDWLKINAHIQTDTYCGERA